MFIETYRHEEKVMVTFNVDSPSLAARFACDSVVVTPISSNHARLELYVCHTAVHTSMIETHRIKFRGLESIVHQAQLNDGQKVKIIPINK